MIHRTILIPAAAQANARALCAGLAGASGAGMFATCLSATGNAPATHYISTGPISDEMAYLLPCKSVDAEGVVTTAPGHPELVPALALKAGITTTQPQIAALYAAIDVSDQAPFDAIARAGLQLVRGAL